VAAAGPAPALASAVEAAFTAGLGVAATVGAVVFAGLATVATVAFRHVPVTAAPVDEPADGPRKAGRPEPAVA
jgi:DHA2 family multidrug resistance protein-like MFS transporter